MVLHDGRREKLLKPVGIAILCLLQVGILSLLGVGETKHTSGAVVGVDHLIHLSIYTIVAAIEDIRKIEPSLILQLLVDGHLVLRVENIEIAVRRNQAGGKLTGVVQMSLSLLTLLGSNDDDTCHRARTINRSSRTILQNLEAFDIIRVQAGDGRRDQGLRVTGSQVVCTHVGNVLHDNAVHNPKRLGRTIDRCCTTHTDLRSRTKGTTNVLHGYTGSTTLQRAADVGNTIQFSFLCVYSVGSTGKQTSVCFLHTSDNHFLQLRFRTKHHLHVGSGSQCLTFHSHVAKHEFSSVRNIQLKFTVNIRDCTLTGSSS